MLSQAHQLFLCLSPSIYKGHRPLGDVKQKPRAHSAVQTHTAQLNPPQKDHPDHWDPFCSLVMSLQRCLKEHLCPMWGCPQDNVPSEPFPQILLLHIFLHGHTWARCYQAQTLSLHTLGREGTDYVVLSPCSAPFLLGWAWWPFPRESWANLPEATSHKGSLCRSDEMLLRNIFSLA